MIYLSGNRDTDFNILLHVDDGTLSQVGRVNKHLSAIVSSEQFWHQRFLHYWSVCEEKPKISWRQYYFFFQKYPLWEDDVALTLRFNSQQRYIRRMVDEGKGVDGMEAFVLSQDAMYYAILSEDDRMINKYCSRDFKSSTFVAAIRKRRLDVLTRMVLIDIKFPVSWRIIFELGKIGAYNYYQKKCCFHCGEHNHWLDYFICGLVVGGFNNLAKDLLRDKDVDEYWVVAKYAVRSGNQEILDYFISRGFDSYQFQKVIGEMITAEMIDIINSIAHYGVVSEEQVFVYLSRKEDLSDAFEYFHLKKNYIKPMWATNIKVTNVRGMELALLASKTSAHYISLIYQDSIRYEELKTEEIHKLWALMPSYLDDGSKISNYASFIYGLIMAGRREMLEYCVSKLLVLLIDAYQVSLFMDELYRRATRELFWYRDLTIYLLVKISSICELATILDDYYITSLPYITAIIEGSGKYEDITGQLMKWR